MPKVLSPRDLVSRPDKMDKTVPHMITLITNVRLTYGPQLKNKCRHVCKEFILNNKKLTILKLQIPALVFFGIYSHSRLFHSF